MLPELLLPRDRWALREGTTAWGQAQTVITNGNGRHDRFGKSRNGFTNALGGMSSMRDDKKVGLDTAG